MNKALKIGVFAVTVIIVSFFVINYLRGKDIFNREAEYHGVYSNVEGLLPSAPVYIKGYKAGKVSQVIYDKAEGTFDVVCSVSKEFAVPSDSRMTIYAVDIMGGKGVRIDIGTSDSMAVDGDRLVSGYEPGLMDGLAAGISPLMEKVGSTLDSLKTTISGLNDVLSEANTASVSRTLAHVESVMKNLKALSAEIGGKSNEVTTLIENLTDFSDDLEKISGKVDSTLTGVDAAVASVNAADLTGTIESLHELLNNINDPDGTVGKLFVDDSVYNSVDSLLVNIDRFVDKIQENPKKYLRISVF